MVKYEDRFDNPPSNCPICGGLGQYVRCGLSYVRCNGSNDCPIYCLDYSFHRWEDLHIRIEKWFPGTNRRKII